MKKIKFLGLGYNEFYQAKVKIYDLKNNLIFEGKTYNAKIKVCLKENTIYRLKATSLNDTINTHFYVSKKDNYVFVFNRARVPMNRIITFLLTDYYYNLPIGKGELYLWQK